MTILLLVPLISYSQKQGNIWYFGNHAGLNFNTSTPTPLLNGQTDFPVCCGWNEGCSSISNSSGSLLFYTNGEKVWNKLQQVMPNGNNLMGYASSTQSSIIVPRPNSQRYFYIFTTDAQENNFANGLRYDVVDMCLDSGLGDIITNQKNIKLIDTVAEKLICVRHSNGTDYWIITHKFNSDAFYSFKLTSTGIIDTVISHTGTIDFNGVGQMVASSNGQMIGYATPSGANGFTLLLDFDPTTGVVSNEQLLTIKNTEYAVSFSPDNSKLYFSTIGHGNIYQYNLNAGNIAAIIASKCDVFIGPDSYRQIQLGPDGKIYLSWTGKSFLSVIENPNSLCTSCNYIDSAIYLGGQTSSFGLPNFITGYNYSNRTVNCEDSFIIIPNVFSPNSDGVNDVFTITTQNIKTLNCKIYNRWGVLVSELTKINEVWDGQTKSGLECTASVYYCIVEYQSSNGTNSVMKGFVQLLR